MIEHNGMEYSDAIYYRVKVRLVCEDGSTKVKSFWTEKIMDSKNGKSQMFFVVNKEGSQPDDRQLVIGRGDDFVSITKGRLNLHYCELEVTDF